MNRKEYKLMVEGWNCYLNEIASDISGITKIKSFVDRIVALREETGKDIKLKAFFNGTVLEVALVNYSVMSMNKIYFQKAWLNHLGVVDKDIKVDGVRDPYVIKYSDVGGGFGPLLYEVGLEIISCKSNGALMSDRSEVSEDAERVWDRYLKRSKTEFNLEAIKMDFSDESWEDVMNYPPFADMSEEEQERFKKTKKYTENDPSDDIYQYSAILNSAENGYFVEGEWKNFESPLAYAYYKIEPEILTYIESLEENILDIDI